MNDEKLKVRLAENKLFKFLCGDSALNRLPKIQPTKGEIPLIEIVLQECEADVQKYSKLPDETEVSSGSINEILIPYTEYHISIKKSLLDLAKLCWLVYKVTNANPDIPDTLLLVDIIKNLKSKIQKTSKNNGEYCIYRTVIFSKTFAQKILSNEFPTPEKVFQTHQELITQDLFREYMCEHYFNNKCLLKKKEFYKILDTLKNKELVVEKYGKQVWVNY